MMSAESLATRYLIASFAPIRRFVMRSNAQGSAAGAAPPLTCDWATAQKTTAVPPSACNPLLGRAIVLHEDRSHGLWPAAAPSLDEPAASIREADLKRWHAAAGE